MPYASLLALERRADLAQYGTNALLLFALELALGIEDIKTVAATALTDGPDDKKCDLIYVDRDGGRAVIAQGYMAQKQGRLAAPSNKASDLHNAVAWALSKDLEQMPDHLRPAAEELDAALADGAVTTLELWYCHNLPESENVRHELDKVEETAASLLSRNYKREAVDWVVRATEVGVRQLENWYSSRQIPILVTDEIALAIAGGFEEVGDRWQAYSTSVPAEWLSSLYRKYKRDLFSANVRDYLGSRQSDKNINNNIKMTAENSPERFWSYNNGITVLVHDYQLKRKRGKGSELLLTGLAIVNGAQTTGAIGSVDPERLSNAKVMARFVKCSDEQVVREIIQYNNSQNRVEAADFRSNDAVQSRLRAEFELLPDAEYRGGRRGGSEDRIKRPPNVLPDSTVAQALAVFHGEPNLAYNERSRIWVSDSVYATYFHDGTTARHIILCFTLLRAVEEAKLALMHSDPQGRKESQKQQADFFRRRGSTFLLSSAIASCIELYLDQAVPDEFRLQFVDGLSVKEGVEAWTPLVSSALAFVSHLNDALEGNLRKRDLVASKMTTFRQLIEATAAGNRPMFEAFASQVEVSTASRFRDSAGS